MSNGLTAANMLRTLPAVLANDPKILAIATVIAEEAEAYNTQTARLLIYSAINSAPEALLDMLARDFKIDWWDTSLTLAEKRAIFKHSFYVHRHSGTKSAVLSAVSAVYADVQLREWFEYDGKPYHFKLVISIAYEDIDPQKHQRVLDRVKFYKNARSVFDGVEYSGGVTNAQAYAALALAGMQIKQTATAEND